MFKRCSSITLVILAACLFFSGTVRGQGTTFNYQGSLTDNGNPANGGYDMQFTLYDTPDVGTGTQQGATVTLTNVMVTAGIFTVQLDFGDCASCFDGTARFLEIAVKRTTDSTYTMLSPRQPVTSTPYAIRSLNATTADGLSLACINCVTSSQIASVDGSAVTGLIPVASIPAGSGNYIQNATSQQASANFNVSGTGTAGTFNATTQFNIGANRVLSSPGTNNLFAGTGAGQANTTGAGNVFAGVGAGQANTAGSNNSFFGFNAGMSNTSSLLGANDNSFFGANAGRSTSASRRNSFFGSNAGRDNGGSENSFFGYNAGLQSTTLANQNAFFGTSAGQNNTGSNNAFFGFAAGVVTANSFNSFFGSGAGQANTGGSNSFFGANAGLNNTASGNSFFGAQAGFANTSGANNSFFGFQAGQSNTGGSNNAAGDNSFFGYNAGAANAGGRRNSIYGSNAGLSNVEGSGNSFFGVEAGRSVVGSVGDIGSAPGTANSFFGDSAGKSATTGIRNTFLGWQAGQSITTGGANVVIGGDAGGTDFAGIANVIIGNGARLDSGGQSGGSANNTLVGSSAGLAFSHVVNNITLFGSNTVGSGDGGTALGAQAQPLGNNSIAIGFQSSTFSDGAIAVGKHTSAVGSNVIVIGLNAATAPGANDAIAIGGGASAGFPNSVAIGAGVTAGGSNTITLGTNAQSVRIPGSLVVTGSVSKGSGSFRIDHPLDPQNKYLYHSFVESPDMMNIYNGNVTTDDKGEATVTLPPYFDALNRDFRYQLTVIGQFAQAIIAEKIKDNRFEVKTDKPRVEVSWQVTGIRHDKYAEDERIKVEVSKPPNERGTCLYQPACQDVKP